MFFLPVTAVDIHRTALYNTSVCAYGAIAQLGERLNGIQEARGSNPLSSTIFKIRPSGEIGRLFFLLSFSKTIKRGKPCRRRVPFYRGGIGMRADHLAGGQTSGDTRGGRQTSQHAGVVGVLSPLSTRRVKRCGGDKQSPTFQYTRGLK